MASQLLRVTQLNAIYLDNEICNTFLQILQDCYQYLPPTFIASLELEMTTILKVILLYSSVYKCDQTFGQQLLSIKYQHMNQMKRLLYLVATILPYLRTKLNILFPYNKMNKAIEKVYSLILILQFVNLSTFLRTGNKPQLIERVLNLKQTYSVDQGFLQFNSKYLARELLWSGFIEILVHVLPLINFHKLKRVLRYINPINKLSTKTISKRAVQITLQTNCAFCDEIPILPHHMGCSHVFCYFCLQGNLKADKKFVCPKCDHSNETVVCERIYV